nr:YitT family protein [Kineosporia babensis]
MTTAPAPPPASSPSSIHRHGLAEDLFALVTGTLITAFGLYLIKSAGAVTGGTAGFVLWLCQWLSWPFGLVFAAVNVPFAVLAWNRKGPAFVGRSVLSVLLLSGFSLLQSRFLELGQVNPVYAVLLGNLVAGVGLLIVLRHHSSLGGFNVIAVLAQERLGWRAGYVLLGLDSGVVVLSMLTADVGTVALSALGVAALNLVLVLNHRPGRYPAADPR